jgi:hypothetical protein
MTGAQPMLLAWPLAIVPMVQGFAFAFFANDAVGAKETATAATATARTIFLIMFEILCQAVDSGHEKSSHGAGAHDKRSAGLQARNREGVICLPLCGKDTAARPESRKTRTKA